LFVPNGIAPGLHRPQLFIKYDRIAYYRNKFQKITHPQTKTKYQNITQVEFNDSSTVNDGQVGTDEEYLSFGFNSSAIEL